MTTNHDNRRPAPRPGGDAATPRALDPARSKSVEAIEQEVDEIVESLKEREQARERARPRDSGMARPRRKDDHKP